MSVYYPFQLFCHNSAHSHPKRSNVCSSDCVTSPTVPSTLCSALLTQAAIKLLMGQGSLLINNTIMKKNILLCNCKCVLCDGAGCKRCLKTQKRNKKFLEMLIQFGHGKVSFKENIYLLYVQFSFRKKIKIIVSLL